MVHSNTALQGIRCRNLHQQMYFLTMFFMTTQQSYILGLLDIALKKICHADKQNSCESAVTAAKQEEGRSYGTLQGGNRYSSRQQGRVWRIRHPEGVPSLPPGSTSLSPAHTRYGVMLCSSRRLLAEHTNSAGHSLTRKQEGNREADSPPPCCQIGTLERS